MSKIDLDIGLKFKIVRNTYRDDKKKFYNAIFAVITIFFITTLLFSSFYGLIAILLVILSLTEIFFPFKYYFYEDKLIIDRFFYKFNKEYFYYKKVVNDRNGIFLSPYRFETRMESFRGILLRIPEDKKKNILEFLISKIQNKGIDK